MRAVSLFAALLLSILASPAFAWGPLGHTIIAMLAEQRLSLKAELATREILLGVPLSNVGNFADDYRASGHPETERWHFVDIPYMDDGSEKYDPARDCAVLISGDCVIAAIGREPPIFLDADQNVFARADALRRLVHWVGDIHQPFHTIERLQNGKPDRGGNELKLYFLDAADPTNMHSLWDSGLISQAGMTAEDYVKHLKADVIPTLGASEMAVTDPVQWAMGSHALARVAYVDANLPGKPLPKLTMAYYTQHITDVDHQLALAAVRLANMLNAMFP